MFRIKETKLGFYFKTIQVGHDIEVVNEKEKAAMYGADIIDGAVAEINAIPSGFTWYKEAVTEPEILARL